MAGQATAATPFQTPLAESWPDGGWVVEISPAVRAERAMIIRDTAALAGLTNSVLIAGIGQVETNFAHCWSEATWACQGPDSSSCGGGPVIAGSADGPCSQQQGGLGLFQFDSGTYSQTISTYGPNIVTMSGNVEAVVPFLVTRAIQSVSGVDNEQEALDWMNSIPIVDGDPLFEEWLYFVAWRYNGCQGCTSQQNKYRMGTHSMNAEFGADFWMSSQLPSDDCEAIGSEGKTLEEDDDCLAAEGPEQYWRHENAGHGGALLWTKATDSAEPSNYAVWTLRFQETGRFELAIFAGGEFGESRQATYQIESESGTTSVTIDQGSTDGWIDLGVFDFQVGSEYQVRLNDNTGEAWQPDPMGVKISVDALRVQLPPDDGEDEDGKVDVPRKGITGDFGEEPSEPASMCSASGSSKAGFWPLLLVLFVVSRRRRVS